MQYKRFILTACLLCLAPLGIAAEDALFNAPDIGIFLKQKFDKAKGKSKSAKAAAPVKPSAGASSEGEPTEPGKETGSKGDPTEPALPGDPTEPGSEKAAPEKKSKSGKQAFKYKGYKGFVTVEDHQIEGALTYYGDAFMAGLRSGVVNGANFFTGPAIPYATLKPSPYLTATVALGHDGEKLDALGAGSVSFMNVNSEASLPWSDGTYSPSQSKSIGSGSFYGDVIGTFQVSKNAALSVFGGANVWGSQLASNQVFGSANAGLAAAFKMSDKDTVHVWTQAEMTVEGADAFQNMKSKYLPNGAVYFEGVQGGLDYKHQIDPANSFKFWGEYSYKPYYQSVDGGADYEFGPFSASLASHYQKAGNPWFVNEGGGAAQVEYKILPELAVSLTGSILGRSDFEGEELPVAYALAGGLAWTPGKNKSGGKIGVSALDQEFENPDFETINAMAQQYQNITPEFSAAFNEALGKSETFEDFIRNFPAGNEKAIIQAIAIITHSQNVLNYNHNEGEVLNLNNIDEIYRRWRQTYLQWDPNSDDPPQDPILRCLGAAQMASVLAVELGKKIGLDIKAGAVSVVTDDGHMVPMIRLPSQGFVFVDWGAVIPTNTFDPEAALAVYQGVRGRIAVVHYFTDSDDDGSYAGHIITKQGLPVLKATGVLGDHEFELEKPNLFDDEPSGSDLTLERSLDALDETLSE
ncbi:MAG: hypothetical protein HY747_06215 [Elusimicrobia bacterium]|nr:hypothetical protein [Elusimicrobiota bacterium]